MGVHCKAVYNAAQRDGVTSFTEKRVGIELLNLRERLNASLATLLRVSNEMQFSDGLARQVLAGRVRTGVVKLVHEPECAAAEKESLSKRAATFTTSESTSYRSVLFLFCLCLNIDHVSIFSLWVTVGSKGNCCSGSVRPDHADPLVLRFSVAPFWTRSVTLRALLPNFVEVSQATNRRKLSAPNFSLTLKAFAKEDGSWSKSQDVFKNDDKVRNMHCTCSMLSRCP